MPDIIYEDDCLLAVNKPVGLVVNLSQTAVSGTLQDFLYGYLKLKPSETEFYQRAGIVHRLDKSTSGILLVAKTFGCFEYLKEQFKNRKITKTYIALVDGVLEDELLEINAPIARNPQNRLKFAVVENGREALTRVERIKVVEDSFTLVYAYPKTGRTHQIRVHLAALNFPVVGDCVYGSRTLQEKWQGRFFRLMLHALEIKFTHPETKKQMTLSVPAPEEFSL